MKRWIARVGAGKTGGNPIKQVREYDVLAPDSGGKGNEKWSDLSGYTLKLESTELLMD